MTAAQNTIQWGGSHRLAGLAAAAAAGLVVAVVGVAISARPVDAPASAAGPATTQTLAPSQSSGLTLDEILSRAHAPAYVPSTSSYLEEIFPQGQAPAFAPSTSSYLEELFPQGQEVHAVAISASDQANAYFQFLLDRHASVAQPKAPAATIPARRHGGPDRN